jgi:hypothetical protein
MSSIKSSFLIILFLLGSLLLIWIGTLLTTEAIAFWRHGIPTEAEVLGLHDISRSTKGGNTYYYKLKVYGEEHIGKFRYELSEGDLITVLALPGPPLKVALGDEESSLFEIFCLLTGSKLVAICFIALIILSVGMDVVLLIGLWNIWFGIDHTTSNAS